MTDNTSNITDNTSNITNNSETTIILDINHINLTTIKLLNNKRNQLLSESDKYMLSDFPIASSNLILIKDYRQSLRDYMDLDQIKNYDYSSNLPLPDFPKFPF